MSDQIAQVINNENVGDFINDFTDLLKKYNVHSDGPVTLNASNLNFRAVRLRTCPEPCKHIVQFCDIHHQNCTVHIECDC